MDIEKIEDLLASYTLVDVDKIAGLIDYYSLAATVSVEE